MTLLQHHILALSLTAITTFGLGLLVFLAEPRKRLNQIFGLYSLAIFWWSLNELIVLTAPDQQTALLWAYIEWPGVIFIAPTFLHSVCLLTEVHGRHWRMLITTSYILSGVFTVLHFFGLVLDTVRPVAYVPFFTNLTPLGMVLPFFFMILVGIGLCQLAWSYRCARNRVQLKYLFWSSLIGYLGGSPDWLFTVGWYLPVVNPFGIYGVPCYSIAMTYAVLHHRLFDVKVAIRRSLVYSILITMLTVGYFGLIYWMERLFQGTFGYQSVRISLGAFALMALAFQPLKIGIQRIIDWLFFQVSYEELAKRMERLEHESQQTEKLKAVATLAAGMAHEIKNPLSSIKTFAEYLPNKYDDPIFREKFSRIINQEVGKINDLVQRLLDFAKPAEPVKHPVQVTQLLGETIELLHGHLLNKHIEVACSYTFNDIVLADAGQLRQAFLNVLLNSIEAIQDRGRISVATISKNSHVEVIVEDTGPGIPQKDLPRIFDPFYTTKPNGTGLGLSVVHSIIQEHGGVVTIDSGTDRGTTVRIQLPLN